MASKPICPQVILMCTEIKTSVIVLLYRNQKLVLFNKLVEFNQYMSFFETYKYGHKTFSFLICTW